MTDKTTVAKQPRGAGWKTLWTLLEEVQAQVELPPDLDAKVSDALWGKRDRSGIMYQAPPAGNGDFLRGSPPPSWVVGVRRER